MSGGITEFLEARIAEDEAAAHKLALTDRRPLLSVASTVNHPARILAECQAKRGLLTLFRSGIKFEVATGEATGWISPLLLLAIPYRDHQDYRQEWEL